MAIGWVSALKLVPWGDVIQAAPHVLKAAKGLLNKSPAEGGDGDVEAPSAPAGIAPPAQNAGELALQHVAQLEARVTQLAQAQHASAQLIQQMAEQQSQIVQTVGLLRTGATRLAWACGVLSVAVIGLLIYVLRS
ncbi:MAG: hypothetical protein RR855_19570 [Comamonas sp.]